MSVTCDRHGLGGEKAVPNREKPRDKDAKGGDKGFVEEMPGSLVQLA